jgi:hypothetical protein
VALNSKQQKTLDAIRSRPTRANIKWNAVESLLASLGQVSQGAGSRVRVTVNGVNATFHNPHPQSECDKGMIESVREFLAKAEVE